MKAKVRQLEWRSLTELDHYAPTILDCRYVVIGSCESTYWRAKFFAGETGEDLSRKEYFPTESEAKAAAQEHWEAMILGCLEP